MADPGQRRHSPGEAGHSHRLDFRDHDRDGRLRHGRRDGWSADRVRRKDHRNASQRIAISCGRGQRRHSAGRYDPDHCGADQDRRHPQGTLEMGEKRPRSFYVLAAFFAAYVLFLYGPMIAIYVLSFQGPDGGLTFPMNGVSLVWFSKLFSGSGIVDIGAAFKRSLKLGLVVMVLTVIISVSAGMAFRKSFRGASFLFYLAIASLIMPSIITSLGIALEFRLLDDFAIKHGVEGWTTAMGLFTSGLGAHLTWTLPFGLLIMFAIFNRFDGRLEEGARDLGATPWQTFRYVVLPIILPSVVGIGLFGFTLSWDELARSSQVIGSVNTVPLELQGLTTTVTKPDIYALGTLTSAVSFLVIFTALIVILILQARQRRHGSDAGKGMV